MLENIIQNNGFNTAISGILIIFVGLVLIALVIHAFNLLFRSKGEETEKDEKEESKPVKKGSFIKQKDIPQDHLIAIAAAVELYWRLHFDRIESQVTFERGELNPGWKVGHKYGQRHHISR